MKIKKLVLVGVYLIGFLFLGSNFGLCEEEFPEWVPKGAIEQAKYQIKLTAEFRNEIGSMYSDEPNKFRMDSTKCSLKYPVKVVQVDYLNYSKGCDIKDLFFDDFVYFREPFDEYYIFSFYQGNTCLGHMNIYLNQEGKWCGDDSSRLKLMYEGRDLLEEISNMYSWREGYRIYFIFPYPNCAFYPEFYIEKNNEAIKIIGFGKTVGWKNLPIDRRMESMKERTERKYKTDDKIQKRYEGIEIESE